MKNTTIVIGLIVVVAALAAAYFTSKKNADGIPAPTAKEIKDANEQNKKFWPQEQKQLRKM